MDKAIQFSHKGEHKQTMVGRGARNKEVTVSPERAQLAYIVGIIPISNMINTLFPTSTRMYLLLPVWSGFSLLACRCLLMT